MAWNDPPSFDYQQISNSGRKFKHRYVLSDTNSKFGQSSQHFHQTSPLSNNNQFLYQSIAPVHQGHPQQPYHLDNSPPTQLHAPLTTYSSNNDNGMIASPLASFSSGTNGAYQGPGNSQSEVNSSDTSDSGYNNFSHNQSMMYPNQHPQYQSPPPPQMMSQQQQAFQPQ